MSAPATPRRDVRAVPVVTEQELRDLEGSVIE